MSRSKSRIKSETPWSGWWNAHSHTYNKIVLLLFFCLNSISHLILPLNTTLTKCSCFKVKTIASFMTSWIKLSHLRTFYMVIMDNWTKKIGIFSEEHLKFCQNTRDTCCSRWYSLTNSNNFAIDQRLILTWFFFLFLPLIRQTIIES